MNFMKNNIHIAVAIVLTLLIFSSCKKFEGDVTVPSFLHIDRIDIVPIGNDVPSIEPGFYTSDIDAVQLICHFKGDAAETNLGVYQLPCTVPVLRNGTMEYLTVTPIVKQNGISGTRIAYPYFRPVKLTDVTLSAQDTTFLGTYDPNADQWYLRATYQSRSLIDVLSEDYFEPTSFTTHFDSVVTWVSNDSNNACTGQGYGLVHVADTDKTVSFFIKDEFAPAIGKMLYLEMDYRTDFEVFINMLGYRIGAGDNITTMSVMAVRPTQTWKKIYINLGRTWGQFNYNTPLRIFFQAVNTQGSEGDIFIDNVKIVTI